MAVAIAIAVVLFFRALQATKGGVAHLPRGIPHALYNPLKTISRYLAIAVPGGMEKSFDEPAEAQEAGQLNNSTHRGISLSMESNGWSRRIITGL